MQCLQAVPKRNVCTCLKKSLIASYVYLSYIHMSLSRRLVRIREKNPRDRQISCEGKKESNLQIGFIPKRKVNWRSKRNRMRQDFPWQMGTPHFFRGNKIRVQNERYWSLENGWYKNMKTYPFALPMLKFSALKVIAQKIKTVRYTSICVSRKRSDENNQSVSHHF